MGLIPTHPSQDRNFENRERRAVNIHFQEDPTCTGQVATLTMKIYHKKTNMMSFRIFSHLAATALLQRLLFLLTTMTTGVAGRCSPAGGGGGGARGGGSRAAPPPPPPQVAHHKLSRPGLSPTRRFPKLLQPAS
jgi:hypothetical protein